MIANLEKAYKKEAWDLTLTAYPTLWALALPSTEDKQHSQPTPILV